MVAAVLGAVVQTAPAMLLEGVVDSAGDRACRASNWRLRAACKAKGLAVPANAVNTTLGALAGAAPVSLHMLTEVPGNEPSLAANSPARLAAHIHGASRCRSSNSRGVRSSAASTCASSSSPRSRGGSTARRCGVCVCRSLLAVGALLIAIIGANVQWLMLARQRDAINTQMTELLLNTFPKTTVVLDAPDQMARQLQQSACRRGRTVAGRFPVARRRPRALARRRCRSTASPRSTITTGGST